MKRVGRLFLTLVIVLLAFGCSSYAEAQERANPRNRGDRGYAQPRKHVHRNDAQQRHPGPDGRYRWRNYNHRQRWDHDRFPRYYRNYRPFSWPYPYARTYDCRWYQVPAGRRLAYDPYSNREYRDYRGYRYVYLCFD